MAEVKLLRNTQPRSAGQATAGGGDTAAAEFRLVGVAFSYRCTQLLDIFIFHEFKMDQKTTRSSFNNVMYGSQHFAEH